MEWRMQQRKPEAGDIYKHFKNNIYEVISLAIHSETEEEMVVYQQKYGEEKVYVRPLEMFLSEVDKEKYPQAAQKYRFELVEDVKKGKEETAPCHAEDVEETDSHQFLMRFLDARDYREKLLVLEQVPADIEDRDITNMALSIDLVIEDGSSEKRLEELTQCLKTKARFECLRFR